MNNVDEKVSTSNATVAFYLNLRFSSSNPRNK